MFNREEYHGKIKEGTLDSLDAYGKIGRPTGGFLYAVLTNNLFEAVGRADLENSASLVSIVDYIYNQMPAGCWGSVEKVASWLYKFAKERATV